MYSRYVCFLFEEHSGKGHGLSFAGFEGNCRREWIRRARSVQRRVVWNKQSLFAINQSDTDLDGRFVHVLRTCGSKRLRLLLQPETELYSVRYFSVEVLRGNKYEAVCRIAWKEPWRNVRAVFRVCELKRTVNSKFSNYAFNYYFLTNLVHNCLSRLDFNILIAQIYFYIQKITLVLPETY